MDPKAQLSRERQKLYKRRYQEIKAALGRYVDYFQESSVNDSESEDVLPGEPMDFSPDPQLDSEHENGDEGGVDDREDDTSHDELEVSSEDDEVSSEDEEVSYTAEAVDVSNPEEVVNNYPEVAINNPLISDDNEIKELRQWAVNYRVKNNAVDALLNILRPRLLPQLPKCAKTLLKTSKASYDIRPMTDSRGRDGEYVYIGIKNQILRHVNPEFHEVESESGMKLVDIDVNVDGLKVFKSSKNDAWVISARIFDKSRLYKTFTIAAYYGQGKPKNFNLFLKDFVREINELSGCQGPEFGEGFMLNGENYRVRLRCVS